MSNDNYEQLVEIATQQGLTLSDFVRIAIEKRCKELGHKIDISAHSWGGRRKNAGRK